MMGQTTVSSALLLVALFRKAGAFYAIIIQSKTYFFVERIGGIASLFAVTSRAYNRERKEFIFFSVLTVDSKSLE